jgi:hypothetical protein
VKEEFGDKIKTDTKDIKTGKCIHSKLSILSSGKGPTRRVHLRKK